MSTNTNNPIIRSLIFFLVLCLLVWTARSADAPATGPVKTDTALQTSSYTSLLTLKQCLERALSNSEKLKAEQLRLKVLEEQQKQMWWEPFSDFSIIGKFSVVPDKCANLTEGHVLQCEEGPDLSSDYDVKNKTWGPSFHAGLSGVLPIPTSGKLWQGKRALDNAYAAEEAQLETFEQQISLDVHRAYYAILGAREIKITLAEGRKHLKKAMQKIEENLLSQTGSDTEIDSIKLKVFDAKLDAMEQEILQIERTALAGLNFLAGADNGRPIDLPDTPQELLSTKLKTLDEYKESAVKNRPEFEALRHGIRALEEKVKFRKSEFAPEIGFAFSYRFGYTPGVEVRKGSEDAETPFVYKNEYNYGGAYPGMAIVAKIPLDYGITVHKLREAEAELQALTADKKYAMQGVLLEVETAYIEATTLHEAVLALEKSKRFAKGWLNAAVQNQAVGVGSANDLKDALKEYFSIMADYHRKVSEYNIALAKLNKAVGDAASLNENP